MYKYIYLYTYIYVCVCICRQDESEREREKGMEGDGLEGSARVSDFLPRISCSIGIVVVVVDNSAESGMGWLESRTAD